MNNWRLITGLVLVASLLSLAVYDLFVEIGVGNSATISKICLDTADRHRVFMLCIAVLLGILIGHLFLPQHVSQTT